MSYFMSLPVLVSLVNTCIQDAEFCEGPLGGLPPGKTWTFFPPSLLSSCQTKSRYYDNIAMLQGMAPSSPNKCSSNALLNSFSYISQALSEVKRILINEIK